MKDLLNETYRVSSLVRKSGVTPSSIYAVMGSREAVFRLARKMPGAVRRTGLPLDVLAADLGIGDGESLFLHLLTLPRRTELIEGFERDYAKFFGEPESFSQTAWPTTITAGCPF
jgi:hypothetical protein